MNKVDVENLKDKTVRRQFQLELGNRFEGLEIDQNLDASWDKVKNISKKYKDEGKVRRYRNGGLMIVRKFWKRREKLKF